MLGPITVIEEDSCYQNNILETWLRLLRILDVPSKCSVRNFVGPARFVSRAPDKSIVSLSEVFDLLCITPLLALLPLVGRETQRIRDGPMYLSRIMKIWLFEGGKAGCERARAQCVPTIESPRHR